MEDITLSNMLISPNVYRLDIWISDHSFVFLKCNFARIDSHLLVFLIIGVSAGYSPFFFSPGGLQHILEAQASPQARLQVGTGGREGSSFWVTGVAPPWLPADDAEQVANSGCTVQQLTPTLFSTLVTPNIRSAHLDTCEITLH